MTRPEPDAVFNALADATRRHLLQALAEHGEATATELAADMPMTRQAVSKQLAALADVGLVEPHRVGRETRYSFRPAPLDEVQAWINQTSNRWDERLARLRRHV